MSADQPAPEAPELPAPELPGLRFVGPLGAGGSGDVFAYDQLLPARRVAVKVLREPVRGAAAAAAFLAEANAMAALEHPHIVPVYAAGVADDGRPYLVMMRYPPPDFEERCRRQPLPLAEALRVGVQIGGAVETAHRHGLLHRDIKPANILTSRYGVAGLADFGLASAPAAADEPEFGVSVPWAAPEVLFGTAPASERSDVYSLAATVWTLLAGRSPFEAAGPGDTAVRLLRRIRTQPVPPIGRPDVPAAVDALLAAALAKDPAARPASALEWAEGVRGLQSRLGLSVTDPLVTGPLVTGPGVAVRGTPQRPAASAGPRPAHVLAAPPPDAALPPAPPALADAPPPPPTPGTPPPAPGTPPPTRPGGRRRRGVLAGLAGLAAAGLVAAGWFALGQPWPGQPAVTIGGTRAGDRVTFTWAWTPQAPGDTFEVLIRERVLPRAEPTLELAGEGRQCISVRVLDAAGAPRGPFSRPGCVG